MILNAVAHVHQLQNARSLKGSTWSYDNLLSHNHALLDCICFHMSDFDVFYITQLNNYTLRIKRKE